MSRIDHTRRESMTRRLYLWGARLDNRWLLRHNDDRRRKLGKLRRIHPPWRLEPAA